MGVGCWVTTQCVTCSLFKHENPSSESQHPHEKPGATAGTYDPSPGVAETSGSLTVIVQQA